MFDESGRIGATIDVLAASELCNERLELVLVDDGSADGTAEVAEKALAAAGIARARVLRLGANRGKGAAVRTGMLAAYGDGRVFVDADLCVSTRDIESCFLALEAGTADVVYGTRAHPESSLHRSQPAIRVASGRAFNLLLRVLGLTRERDTQCGLKGFAASTMATTFEPLATERFAFDVEVLARAHRAGLRIEPLAVRWSHVEASRVRPVQDGLNMAGAALRIRRLLGREERLGVPERAEALKGMDAEAIESMGKVEREHWWFRAKRELVVDELDRRQVVGTVVDIGSGTGGMLEQLRASGWSAVGVELDDVALSLTAHLDPRPAVAQAPAEAIPLRSASAAAVVSLDVLEHLDDDVVGLRELSRVAGPGGIIIVGVPAYQWAWSEHDVRLGHRRRYDRPQLRAAATAAGLEVLRCSHYHSWLTPVAFLVRRTPLGRLLRGSAEEASFVHPAINRALQWVGAVERTVMRATDLPAGLSILLVARVPDEDD